VVELRFGEQAGAFLDSLESDAGRHRLLGHLNTALDRLEADPGDAWCRRRRYENLGVWGIVVRSDGDDWLITWEPHDQEVVWVHSITRDP
jgi:hypothetical protein